MDKQEMLQRLAGGHFTERLAEHLSRVAGEVLSTGRQGTVTVTLKVVTPDQGAIDPMVNISVSFRTALPVKDAVTTGFFYFDDEFHRSPPNQHTFPDEIFDEKVIDINEDAKEVNQ